MADDSKKFQIEGQEPPEGVSPTIVGISFLVSTFLSAFVAAYLAVQGSVDKWIDSQKEIKILEIQARRHSYAEADTNIPQSRISLPHSSDKKLFNEQRFKEELVL